MVSQVHKKFPKARFYPALDAVRGAEASDFVDVYPAVLDQPFLREFSNVQVDTLKMMDRMNALDTFDFAGRERLYYRQLAFWKAVVEKERPDLVVFSTVPHMIFDHIIYELCQSIGIRTVMFESTPMRGLVFLMETFDGKSQAEILYRKMLETEIPTSVPLKPETQDYLNALRGAYDQVPKYMRRGYKEELPYKKRSLTLSSAVKKMFDFQNYPRYIEKQRRIIRSKLRVPSNYLVQRGKKPEQSEMSFWEYSHFRRRSRRYMQKLESRYAHLARPIDLDKPFIYIGLSFQPERTSSPMAGVYVNQHLIVELISQSVPDGWMVYVKEHPMQFTPSVYFRAQCGRSPEYYDDLAAIPNVRLVPMPMTSFDLIDRAQAIATVTGSVGWEAINRGKPVLLFGHPWYRGCEGTFKIDSYQDCLNVIDQIQSDYKIDTQKLNLFVHAIEKVGIEGFVEPHLRIFNVTDQENAARIVRALQDFWVNSSSK